MQVRYVLPVDFLVETVIRNCTSCKMGHHHILGFLFVSGLKTFSLICGLGVVEKNCHRDVPILFYVFSSCGFRPIK